MNILLSALVFITGLCIGSFLNVVSDRLPRGKTLGGRSRCDHCKKTLSFLDLVPVFSYIFLFGRCRYCRNHISFQYAIVELLTGCLFLLLFLIFIPSSTVVSSISFFLLLVIYSCFIGIFFADLKYRIIPDELTIVFLVSSIFYRFFTHTLLWEAVFSGVGLSLVFLALFLITGGRGMGMGDVKFAIPMGFFLGFPLVIVGFYTAFLTGAVVSIILILVGKKRFGQTIAFGPFLVFATIVSNLYGQILWQWFSHLLGI